MNELILPIVDFTGYRQKKSINVVNKPKPTTKKQIDTNKVSGKNKLSVDNTQTTQKTKQNMKEQTDHDSVIEVDDKSSDFEDVEELIDDLEESTKTTILDMPPVYDGVEPYFMFKRRWDAYHQKKINGKLHTHVLNFLNELFDAEYKSLISIKKIKADDMPPPKQVVDVINNNTDFKNNFKIKYSQNIPSYKMINSLLNKVDFSFVESKTKRYTYYSVKHLRQIKQSENGETFL
jgi:hypothetical protein